MDSDPVLDAFLYFYYVDLADAQLRHVTVEFSSLTCRLAGVLIDNWGPQDITQELATVRNWSRGHDH